MSLHSIFSFFFPFSSGLLVAYLLVRKRKKSEKFKFLVTAVTKYPKESLHLTMFFLKNPSLTLSILKFLKRRPNALTVTVRLMNLIRYVVGIAKRILMWMRVVQILKFVIENAKTWIDEVFQKLKRFLT